MIILLYALIGISFIIGLFTALRFNRYVKEEIQYNSIVRAIQYGVLTIQYAILFATAIIVLGQKQIDDKLNTLSGNIEELMFLEMGTQIMLEDHQQQDTGIIEAMILSKGNFINEKIFRQAEGIPKRLIYKKKVSRGWSNDTIQWKSYRTGSRLLSGNK